MVGPWVRIQGICPDGVLPVMRLQLAMVLGPMLLLAPLGADEEGAEGPEGEGKLYLHCFRASRGMKAPGSLDSTPSTPPQRLISMLVKSGEPFDLALSSSSKGIAGVIRREKDGVEVRLTGRFGTSSHQFEGSVALDEVFDPQLQGFSGAVTGFRCVISTKREIDSFLEAQSKLDASRLEQAATARDAAEEN